MTEVGFIGAVLTGGASRRMGADKASLLVDGTAMADRVATALRAAGASEVVRVPGDVAELHPGEGPLGGIVSALASATAPVVVVLACDLVSPDPAAIAQVVAALAPDHGDVAVPVVEGRRQWLHAAWRRTTCAAPLASAFEAGERAVHRAAAGLAIVEVDGLAPVALADADTPADLPADRPSRTAD
jgi:molybdenum cofactor guanylyltransferase